MYMHGRRHPRALAVQSGIEFLHICTDAFPERFVVAIQLWLLQLGNRVGLGSQGGLGSKALHSYD